MRRRAWLALIGLGLLFFSTFSAQAAPQAVNTGPYALVAEVNALRAAYGLPAYAVNSTLMSLAQQQAEFMSVNGVSHIGYGGTHPFQRALNAGYPLAGDLNLGGFFSENIIAGAEMSVQDAVSAWQGDSPHLNTMLSPNFLEIGAGAAVVDGYVYYVIDCARPTNGGTLPVLPTLPGGTPGMYPTIVPAAPLVSTIFPSTPLADGNLYHLVRPGETLWLIAITYGVHVAEIRQLNGMSETDAIYPSEKLLIRKSTGTLTPQAVTETLPAPSPTLPKEKIASPPPASSATLALPTPLPPAAGRVFALNGNTLLALGGIVLAGVLLTLALVRK